MLAESDLAEESAAVRPLRSSPNARYVPTLNPRKAADGRERGRQLHAFTDAGVDVPGVARDDARANLESYTAMHAFIASSVSARNGKLPEKIG